MFISARRPRHKRLVAALAATYHPRRHFRLGQDIGWHWQIDDPNTLYRRRNRLTYTRDFSNAAWARTRILSVTADADGVGDLVVPDATLSTHAINQQSAVTVGATTTYVVRAKPGGYDFVILSLGSSSLAYFNVSAGTVGTTSNAISTSIAAAADAPGYYDCTLVGIPNSANCFIYVAQTNGVVGLAGDGTSGVYIARAQLETYTTTPTEYQDVPTTWAQAYLDAVGAQNIYAWTDTAGTIPVTAIGDGIGLLLGREYGGVRGSEMASANYATAATYDNITTVVSASAFTQTVGTTLGRTYLNLITVVGKTYEVSSSITTTDASGVLLYARTLPAGTGTILATSPSIASGGTARVIFTATTTVSSVLWSTQTVARIVNATGITVREVPGTHLTQATGTAKPTLSARVNLLLASNDFTSASWVKTNILSTTADADGIGDLVIPSTANATHAVTQSPVTAGVPTVMHVRAKANGYNWLAVQLGSTGAAYVNISSGAAGSASSGYSISTPVAAGSGYFDFTVTRTDPNSTAASIFVANADGGASFAGNGTSGVYLARADCRTADDAAKNIPAYQRVGATATDHDTDGFPHFALADGTDDCWASVATVDGSATDKLSLVAVVTKLSDAAIGLPMELSPIASPNNGSFFIGAPSGTPSPRFRFGVKGTDASLRSVDPDVAALSAPVTAVLAAHADLGAPITALRVNDVSYTPSTGALGGNFGNYTLYVLSRAGASLRFNGRFYGSTGRFGPMSDSERNNLTRWWMKRIGTA